MFLLALFSALVLCGSAQYSSDQCSWTGSGLTHEAHARDVEQVYLRCSEGSFEWLYPTGAVIVNLRPNLSSRAGLRACVKPRRDSSGAAVMLERDGELRLLLSEEDQAAGRLRCFSLQEGALFIEAIPRRDIGRRITAFQYQLISEQTHMHTDVCSPCSDEDLLLSVCTSDFAVRGVVLQVDDDDDDANADDEGQRWALLSVTRVFHQKSRVFVSGAGRRWTGRVKVSRRCDPLEGSGHFLFTGALRFGEPRISCTASYTHFTSVYRTAESAGTNPCYIHTD